MGLRARVTVVADLARPEERHAAYAAADDVVAAVRDWLAAFEAGLVRPQG